MFGIRLKALRRSTSMLNQGVSEPVSVFRMKFLLLRVGFDNSLTSSLCIFLSDLSSVEVSLESQTERDERRHYIYFLAIRSSVSVALISLALLLC